MLKTPGAIPNTQCGFIPGKGTDDAIIMSRVLASLALSKGQNLYTCFVDLQSIRPSRQECSGIYCEAGVPR
jgi:hypothetical protein